MEKPRDEEIHTATKEEMDKVRRLLVKIDKMKKSPLKGVSGGECPTCGGICDYADDLTFEYYTPGGKITIANLKGLECRRCGDQAYDLKSVGIIEEQFKVLPPAGYEVGISKLGAGKLGIYFTKDLMRVMDLQPGKKAIVTPITRRKMVVEI